MDPTNHVLAFQQQIRKITEEESLLDAQKLKKIRAAVIKLLNAEPDNVKIKGLIEPLDCRTLSTLLLLKRGQKREINQLVEMVEKLLKKRKDRLRQIKEEPLIEKICKELMISLDEENLTVHYDVIAEKLVTQLPAYLSEATVSKKQIRLFAINKMTRMIFKDFFTEISEIQRFNSIIGVYRAKKGIRKRGPEIFQNFNMLVTDEQLRDQNKEVLTRVQNLFNEENEIYDRLEHDILDRLSDYLKQ